MHRKVALWRLCGAFPFLATLSATPRGYDKCRKANRISRKEPTMKSHLIPEPQPIESYIHETDAAQFMTLDQAVSVNPRPGKISSDRSDEFHRDPEIPMRNFLRIVFVH
jgi:hypothetical protein